VNDEVSITFLRGHAHVVAIAVGDVLDGRAHGVVGVGHPVGGDVLAVVGVLDQRRLTAMVLVVGQPGEHHASGQRVGRVRPDHAAGSLDEVGNRLRQLRLGRVAVHVEDEDLAGVEPAGPEKSAVVGESGVMRLVPAADRKAVDHLAEGRRAVPHVDGDQLVRPVAHAVDTQRPDVDILLDAGNLRHVGRHAGLVGPDRRGRHRDPDQQHAAQSNA
jgi:hypothetical protein